MNANWKHPWSERFELGRLHILPGARQEIAHDELLQAIRRHARGDWGDCTPEQRAQNELSLDGGLTFVSRYHDLNATEFHVITLLDHSITVVVLPDECWF